MVESFSTTIESPRLKLIRARAFLDATDYINLMATKSPDSLELRADGLPFINLDDSGTILAQAREFLKLSDKELQYYIEFLAVRVHEILSHKPKNIN